MQIKPIVFAVSAIVSAGLVQAQTAPAVPVMPYPSPLPQAGATGTPKTADQWVARMADFTQNASAFKDPAAFAAWTNAMTDPSMVSAMGMHMMEPGNLLRSMTTMMQPGTTANYMQFMMDPNIYLKWGGAMMNPMWYTQIATSMADPGKMMRWMMLPMDPKMWNMGMQAMNPNLYMKWMMTPTDPRAMSLMFAPMNPQLYGSMVGGMMNPGMVGGADSMWGTFMYPRQPVVQVQGAAPVASPINVFDPSTWFSMFNMFGGFPTMPTLPATGAPAAFTFPTFGVPAAQATVPAPIPVQSGAAATMSLSGDALFKTGKSSVKDLSAEGRAKLDELVAQIKALGNIDRIKVTGHADKTGKPAANKTLSQARAKAVASYLKSKGVKAGNFTIVGLGDTQPVVTCDMNQPKDALKACLAPNRRVEVEVLAARK